MKSPRTTSSPRDAARTRLRILAAAKTSFARHGYEGTTVRAVATRAGVSPNLITRYFGGKAGLYTEATAVDLRASEALPGAASSVGRRIAHAVVRRWEGVHPEDPLLMMIRSAGGSEEAARVLARFLKEQASRPLERYLIADGGMTGEEARDQSAAVTSFILGVATARYVARSEPLASAKSPALEEWLAERIQRLLDASPSHLSDPSS